MTDKNWQEEAAKLFAWGKKLKFDLDDKQKELDRAKHLIEIIEKELYEAQELIRIHNETCERLERRAAPRLEHSYYYIPKNNPDLFREKT